MDLGRGTLSDDTACVLEKAQWTRESVAVVGHPPFEHIFDLNRSPFSIELNTIVFVTAGHGGSGGTQRWKLSQ
jgi:hypothetical protein